MIMASSSSSATSQVKHDVFLSFRGGDTWNNFTSYLYEALCDKKIETFIDNRLVRGDDISSSHLNTIEASKLSVIVFSKDYASSRWCLQELEHILECKRTFEQRVIPVFYHVDPSDVRNQRGTFGDAFARLQERFGEELNRWKAALTEAANLSGWHVNEQVPEPQFVAEIVGYILEILNGLFPGDEDGLVGAESNIQKVESLLRLESDCVCMVGIWGIGGIGKTTISRAVYSRIFNKFDGCFFAESIREESDKSDPRTDLKRRLFSAILKCEKRDVEYSYTRERFSRTKALIVFDDVTSFDQIEKLIGDPKYLLGRGSKVIITSRDRQVLRNCEVDDDNIHEVKGLFRDDAIQLFSKYAFRQNHCLEDYMELSKRIVDYIQGVPLALKVLGSSLLGKTKDVWESEMQKLEKHSHQGIQILRISYDEESDDPGNRSRVCERRIDISKINTQDCGKLTEGSNIGLNSRKRKAEGRIRGIEEA